MQNNSKINTVLLVVLIVLVLVFGLWFMVGNKKEVARSGDLDTAISDNNLDTLKPQGENPSVAVSTQKTYSDNGFSFKYDTGATLKPTTLAKGTSLELKKGDARLMIVYYLNSSDTGNFSPNYSNSKKVTINGKVFYYNDVKVEGDWTSRQYTYVDGEKIISIGEESANSISLIDLGSVDLQLVSKNVIEGNKNDLVSFSISPGSSVQGVVSYTGSVKGAYFSEGNILINILDSNKNVIKNSNAKASSNWMTSDAVSFGGSIDLSGLAKGPAYVQIHNDNASGEPSRDKIILIPIVIK